MNEMKLNLPPALQSALDEFYAAPQPDPGFAESLQAQLYRRQIELTQPAVPKQELHSLPSTDRRSFMQLLRTRPILAVMTAILALLLLTGIAFAVVRLAGFIPGIGFVNHVHSVLETPVIVRREIIPSPTADTFKTDSPRIVQTPTSGPINESPADTGAISAQEQQGITITIEQVVAEADRLVIAYQVTGLPSNIFGPERAQALQAYAEEHPEEPMSVQVRLPDGTFLGHIPGTGGHCEGGGDLTTSWISCQSIYSPLPDGVNQFTLEIHRLQNALPGELPEDWAIPVQLSPVSSETVSSLQEPDLRSQPLNGITLRLLKADQSPAQTAFQLGLEWQSADSFVHHTAPITLQDAQGRYYVFTGGPDGGSYSADHPGFTTLPSLVTTPIEGSSPLTFRLDWITMSASTRGSGADNGAGILTFDPGDAPAIGREWPLDQTFQAGQFNLHFIKARLKAAQDNGIVLELDIETAPEITGINLHPKEGSSFSTESGYDRERGILVSRVTIAALPTRPVDLYVSEVIYKVKGPWEITWQPLRLNAPIPTPTPAPTRLAPPNPAPTLNAPLLSEMEALLSKAAAPAGPGWVHQVSLLDQTSPTGLDTGDQMEEPLQMRVDGWFLLDEQGYARTTIDIRKTLEGEFVSADVENGIYHFNFPEGRSGIGQDIYLARPSYYYNPLSTFNGYVAEGGQITREISTVDGTSCYLYTAAHAYDPPLIYSWEAAPVRVMAYSACIDPLTGAVLQLQSRMTYADGTTRIKDTTSFISPEKTEDLSEEARQLLDKIIMP